MKESEQKKDIKSKEKPVQVPMTFQEAMKKALNTPLKKKKANRHLPK